MHYVSMLIAGEFVGAIRAGVVSGMRPGISDAALILLLSSSLMRIPFSWYYGGGGWLINRRYFICRSAKS